MPRQMPQLSCYHRGFAGEMGRQLLPGDEPGGNESSAGESDRRREGSLDTAHVRLEDTRKNVWREDVVQLRSTCKDDKTRVVCGRRLWKLVKQSVDKFGLTRRGAESASDCLEDCAPDWSARDLKTYSGIRTIRTQ
jgi:hypothetical protein